MLQVHVLDTAELRERTPAALVAEHYLGGIQAAGEQLHYAMSDARGGGGVDLCGGALASASPGPVDWLE